jgi:hypothetical protein
MNRSTTTALVAGALVLGLTLGGVGIATAAPDDVATTEAGTVQGLGLRIGQAIRDAGARLVDVVADLTGLSTDEVFEEARDGKSLPVIAEENGVSSDELVDELFAARKSLIDERVAAGLITQDQADWALENMRDRIEDRVLSDHMGPGLGGPGGMGGMGGRHGGDGGIGRMGGQASGFGPGDCLAPAAPPVS